MAEVKDYDSLLEKYKLLQRERDSIQEQFDYLLDQFGPAGLLVCEQWRMQEDNRDTPKAEERKTKQQAYAVQVRTCLNGEVADFILCTGIFRSCFEMDGLGPDETPVYTTDCPPEEIEELFDPCDIAKWDAAVLDIPEEILRKDPAIAALYRAVHENREIKMVAYCFSYRLLEAKEVAIASIPTNIKSDTVIMIWFTDDVEKVRSIMDQKTWTSEYQRQEDPWR